VAGHVGFEPANPWASYPTEIPWQLCLKECKPGGGRPFAWELRCTNLQLRRRFSSPAGYYGDYSLAALAQTLRVQLRRSLNRAPLTDSSNRSGISNDIASREARSPSAVLAIFPIGALAGPGASDKEGHARGLWQWRRTGISKKQVSRLCAEIESPSLVSEAIHWAGDASALMTGPQSVRESVLQPES
jgi:hypothetical protein